MSERPVLALALPLLPPKSVVKHQRTFNWPFFMFWLGYTGFVLGVASALL